ncbi:MAG: hypothetical protein RR614_16350, partial [Eubacterium sp.]
AIIAVGGWLWFLGTAVFLVIAGLDFGWIVAFAGWFRRPSFSFLGEWRRFFGGVDVGWFME